MPLIVAAGAAFAAGAATGAAHGDAGHAVAARFAADWARGDYGSMYALLTPAAQRRVGLTAFRSAYQQAAATATATGVSAGRAGSTRDDTVSVPMRVNTRVWGRVSGTLRVPLTDTDDGPRVDWRPSMAFPGLRPGEQLTRSTRMPPRAAILARDGRPLAKGPERSSQLPSASEIVGSLGAIPSGELGAYRARGYPADARVGSDGLERIFEARLAGTPGGTLTAGARTIATAAPRKGAAVRTTIDPEVEQAAVTALGGRLGGVVAMRPDGQVLALAGIAFSATQPPGSTFKIITTTGVLEAGLAKATTTFPVQSYATLSGVELHNADDELCGGTLANAFAVSCNSVFAPLGAKLGARKLAAVAHRYGFNKQPWIPGAAMPTLPPADQIGDDLAVGSTAIGQGKVAATALEMTEAAATIAHRGRRPRPLLALDAKPRYTRVTSRRIAHTIRGFMEQVVEHGTGTAAQISGVQVAGKTGTAELTTTVPQNDGEPPDTTDTTPEPPGYNTDAWFVSFAPAEHPKVVVGVMLVHAGAGGSSAAPAARAVIESALQQHGG